ncbi:MAG: hypothetical protein IH840_17405, partial [Candidatus Heimdallarchaeota archaeon]|nr:hypothetical protein [Candidatus Heimdallarchaeota archaeon]
MVDFFTKLKGSPEEPFTNRNKIAERLLEAKLQKAEDENLMSGLLKNQDVVLAQFRRNAQSTVNEATDIHKRMFSGSCAIGLMVSSNLDTPLNQCPDDDVFNHLGIDDATKKKIKDHKDVPDSTKDRMDLTDQELTDELASKSGDKAVEIITEIIAARKLVRKPEAGKLRNEVLGDLLNVDPNSNLIKKFEINSPEKMLTPDKTFSSGYVEDEAFIWLRDHNLLEIDGTTGKYKVPDKGQIDPETGHYDLSLPYWKAHFQMRAQLTKSYTNHVYQSLSTYVDPNFKGMLEAQTAIKKINDHFDAIVEGINNGGNARFMSDMEIDKELQLLGEMEHAVLDAQETEVEVIGRFLDANKVTPGYDASKAAADARAEMESSVAFNVHGQGHDHFILYEDPVLKAQNPEDPLRWKYHTGEAKTAKDSGNNANRWYSTSGGTGTGIGIRVPSQQSADNIIKHRKTQLALQYFADKKGFTQISQLREIHGVAFAEVAPYKHLAGLYNYRGENFLKRLDLTNPKHRSVFGSGEYSPKVGTDFAIFYKVVGSPESPRINNMAPSDLYKIMKAIERGDLTKSIRHVLGRKWVDGSNYKSGPFTGPNPTDYSLEIPKLNLDGSIRSDNVVTIGDFKDLMRNGGSTFPENLFDSAGTPNFAAFDAHWYKAMDELDVDANSLDTATQSVLSKVSNNNKVKVMEYKSDVFRVKQKDGSLSEEVRFDVFILEVENKDEVGRLLNELDFNDLDNAGVLEIDALDAQLNVVSRPLVISSPQDQPFTFIKNHMMKKLDCQSGSSCSKFAFPIKVKDAQGDFGHNR